MVEHEQVRGKQDSPDRCDRDEAGESTLKRSDTVLRYEWWRRLWGRLVNWWTAADLSLRLVALLLAILLWLLARGVPQSRLVGLGV